MVTVDFWVYLADNTYYYPFQIRDDSIFKLGCFINGATMDAFISSYSVRDISNSVGGCRGQIPLKEWCHVAIVRDNTTFYFFINGICVSTIKYETRLIQKSSDDIIRVGGTNSNIDEFRISTYPIWTKNFTPPISSYDVVIERHTLMVDKKDNYYGILKE